jgi:hypothetical protein
MTPYGDTPFRDDPPEVWQAVSGMAFKTQMGLLYAPEAGGRQVGPALDPLGEELSALGNGAVATVTLSASQREVYLSDMRAHGVDAIVVGPSATEDQEVQFFTELTGQRGESTGGVVVWFDVHP